MYVLFGIKQSKEGMIDVDNLLQKTAAFLRLWIVEIIVSFFYVTAMPGIYCVVLYLCIELPLPLWLKNV